MLLFAIMVVSGLFLALHYNPSPDKAYQSVDYIMNEVPLGAILRGIHHWGASAMVLVMFLHLMSNFFSGTYKAPRELTWIGGVGLLLITLGLGFTGYLLPWDMKAYWATVVSTNIPKDIPIIGKFVTRLALGGDTVSGSTLTRFYAVHAMLLPALLALFAAIHIYLMRLHGLADEEPDRGVAAGVSPAAEGGILPPASVAESSGAPTMLEELPPGKMPGSTAGRMPAATARELLYRFYPEHAWRSSLVFAVVFLALITFALFGHMHREPVAGTLVESYLPRPEWYYLWLFQLLTYFPGKWEAVGSLAIPIIGLALLFAAPFLGRNRRLGAANRPLALAVGVTCTVGIVYLTAMGWEGARPYGQVIPVPDRTLTPNEGRGLFLYAERECAYCHQITGLGGHRVGPDLSNVVAKRRTKEYLVSYLKNPQAIKSTSIMPKYDLPEADLRALADFMLALDFRHQPVKLLQRAEALKQQ